MVELRDDDEGEGDAGKGRVSRWLPDVPLPRYAYVPGVGPHPLRDPDGHRCTHAHALIAERAEVWWQDRAYLYGFDLLHGRYLWECHEVWEARWKDRALDDPRRWLLQGLIQLAAARLKEHMGDPRTAARLRAACRARLDRTEVALGSDVDGLHIPQVRTQLVHTIWPFVRLTLPPETR